jgi:hypothetical protein
VTAGHKTSNECLPQDPVAGRVNCIGPKAYSLGEGNEALAIAQIIV